ncbi:MAG: hypothetical protein H6996_02710 [Moraxellaceae bacterium]|nr:hypothetical protein [Moraxellaceae bacterium]MCP5176415.1 hypothetical protein [Moraxellaceae bacterium]
MKKISDILNWVDIKDAEQIEWIKEYFKKHAAGRYYPQIKESNVQIERYNSSYPFVESDLQLLNNRMRSAWRQKQFRSKQNGKKTYSFVMSVNIEQHLKALAGSKGEIRQTLEQLINERFKGETPIIMELKNKYKELQAKATKIATENLTIKDINHSLNQACRYKDDELSRLQKEIKRLQQDKANLLNELKQLKEKHNNQFRNGNLE